MCAFKSSFFALLMVTAVPFLEAQAPIVTLSDGNKIPMLGLGTYGFAEDSAKLRQAVLWAIDVGYRYIDTEAIPQNEEQIGLGIADAINNGTVKREDLVITTRLWRSQRARDEVVPTLRKSLGRLGLEYVDLYLLHSPRDINRNIDYVETWQGMEDAKRLGLTISVGVSNFKIDQIEDLIANNRIVPVVNQLEVHPSNTQEQLVSECQERSIAIIAYSPFGFLPFKSNRKAPSPRVDDPILTAIAEKYGKTPFQVALRYLIERNIISLPKSNNKELIRQNINVFDFKLTDKEITAISKFNSNSSVEDHY